MAPAIRSSVTWPTVTKSGTEPFSASPQQGVELARDFPARRVGGGGVLPRRGPLPQASRQLLRGQQGPEDTGPSRPAGGRVAEFRQVNHLAADTVEAVMGVGDAATQGEAGQPELGNPAAGAPPRHRSRALGG